MAWPSAKFTAAAGHLDAYQYASERTRESIDFLSTFWREKGNTALDDQDDTILHFLGIYGNVPVLEALIQQGLLTSEELMGKNSKGDTPLHETARFGRKEAAQVILNKDRALAFVRNDLGETPLFLAAAYGHREVFFMLLEKFHSDCLMARNDGSTVLHAVVNGGYYLFAFKILDLYPELATRHDVEGATPLDLLASRPFAFKSGSHYLLKNIGSAPSILFHMFGAAIYSCIPALYVESKLESTVDNPRDDRIIIKTRKRFFISKIFFRWGWLGKLYDSKQIHIIALALGRRMLSETKDWTDWAAPNPLIRATKNGIVELATEILIKFPDAANSLDVNGRNILHTAVKHKCRSLYKFYMTTVAHKERMLADIDKEGNTILHLSTNNDPVPNIPLNKLNQMTWDVSWFKRAKRDTKPHLWRLRNNDNMTAEDLFEKHHSSLRTDAEKAAKEMNQGLMIVSTLIGTVNIAAMLTIPGGFDQSKGHPVLLKNHRKEVEWFLFYVIASLFASIFTLGGLLSIQISAFHMHDFYIALPLQYLISTTALFYSTTFTVTTFAQAYILESRLTVGFVEGDMVACVLMGLFYIDSVYLTLAHIFDVIYYLIFYKSPNM